LIRQDNNGRQYVSNAGSIRNQEMVDAGAAMCLAFHRDLAASKGIRDCVRRAIRVGQSTLRRSHNRKKCLGGWHSVTTWVSEYSSSQGHVACDGRSSEIAVIS